MAEMISLLVGGTVHMCMLRWLHMLSTKSWTASDVIQLRAMRKWYLHLLVHTWFNFPIFYAIWGLVLHAGQRSVERWIYIRFFDPIPRFHSQPDLLIFVWDISDDLSTAQELYSFRWDYSMHLTTISKIFFSLQQPCEKLGHSTPAKISDYEIIMYAHGEVGGAEEIHKSFSSVATVAKTRLGIQITQNYFRKLLLNCSQKASFDSGVSLVDNIVS